MKAADIDVVIRLILIAIMSACAGAYMHSWTVAAFVFSFAVWMSNLMLRISQ